MSTATLEDEYLTTTQAGRLLGFSAKTVARLFDEGFITGYKIPMSRHRRLSRASVEKIIRDGVPEQRPETLPEREQREANAAARERLKRMGI